MHDTESGTNKASRSVSCDVSRKNLRMEMEILGTDWPCEITFPMLVGVGLMEEAVKKKETVKIKNKKVKRSSKRWRQAVVAACLQTPAMFDVGQRTGVLRLACASDRYRAAPVHQQWTLAAHPTAALIGLHEPVPVSWVGPVPV